MPQAISVEMTQARFAALVDAYGADPMRWPAAERDAAEHWQASNVAAQAQLSDARGLDRVLDASELPVVSPTLERRLLADFDHAQRRWSLHRVVDAAADAIWPGAPPWQPACALGLAFAAGLGLALFAPLDIPQQDEVSSGAFALDSVSDLDAGQGV